MWVEKNGPTYRIRDLVAGKKVTIESGYATKTAAKNAMKIAEGEKLQGLGLVPRGGKTLVKDWIALWWPVYKPSLKPSSVPAAERINRRYILPLLGDMALEELSENLTIQSWVAELLCGFPGQDPLAPKTVRNAHGQLHTILKEAVAAKLVRFNACEGTKLPEVVPHEMRFLTEPEAARLLAKTPDHWRPLVAMLIGTGLRWSEAVGLKVKDVDVFARTVTVSMQLQELADTAELVWVTPKSRMSRRTVPMPAYTVNSVIPLVAGRDRDSVVFTAVQGGYVRYRVFWRTWSKITMAAGLPGLRIHDLRHTQVGWLISANVALTGIQRRLGHASIAVTSDRYGHLLPVVDDNILAALDAALPPLKVPSQLGPISALSSGAVGESVGESARDQRGRAGKIKDERAGQAA